MESRGKCEPQFYELSLLVQVPQDILVGRLFKVFAKKQTKKKKGRHETRWLKSLWGWNVDFVGAGCRADFYPKAIKCPQWHNNVSLAPTCQKEPGTARGRDHDDCTAEGIGCHKRWLTLRLLKGKETPCESGHMVLHPDTPAFKTHLNNGVNILFITSLLKFCGTRCCSLHKEVYWQMVIMTKYFVVKVETLRQSGRAYGWQKMTERKTTSNYIIEPLS